MRRFEQQVAIVTGGGSGIGAATARRLGSEGASVVVADRNLDGAEATVAAIRANGGEATAVQVDVSRRDQVEAMLAAALAAYGKVDVLAAIAGIAHSEPFLDVTDEWWDKTLAVNLTGVFLLFPSGGAPHGGAWHHGAHRASGFHQRIGGRGGDGALQRVQIWRGWSDHDDGD